MHIKGTIASIQSSQALLISTPNPGIQSPQVHLNGTMASIKASQVHLKGTMASIKASQVHLSVSMRMMLTLFFSLLLCGIAFYEGYEAGMHAGKSKPDEPQSKPSEPQTEPQQGGFEREAYERDMLAMREKYKKGWEARAVSSSIRTR